jgi:hypothetical protein
MFCPKVLYNSWTRLWVLWVNWIDAKEGFSKAFYATATSTSPFGPFRLHSVNVTTVANPNVGDFALWADPLTGAGFIIYTGNISSGHLMSVEALTPDYLQTSGREFNSGVLGSNVEAPSLIQQGDRFIASFGQCCCYCGEGSPVTFYSAPHPLGPYEAVGVMTKGIKAQQTNLLTYIDGEGKEGFLFQGDRWQSAPDGIKGHDLTYTGVVNFDKTNKPVPIPPTDYVVINITVLSGQTLRGQAAGEVELSPILTE